METPPTPDAAKTSPETETPPSVTLEQAAKLAKCKPEDVEAFKDYGEFVVVVTVAGKKHRCEKAKK